MLEFGIQWNGAITHPWKQPLDFVGQCGRGGSGCGRRTMPLMNEDELNNGLGPEERAACRISQEKLGKKNAKMGRSIRFVVSSCNIERNF